MVVIPPIIYLSKKIALMDSKTLSMILNLALKNLLKKKEISEDEEKKNEKEIQVITDKFIKLIDDKVSSKEKEIMTI